MNYRTKWFLFFRAIAYNHACATHVLHLSFTCTQFNPRFVGWRLLWPNLFSLFVFYFICGFLNLFRLAIYLLYFFFFLFLWQFCTRGQNWGKVITQASCLYSFFFYLLGGYLSEKWKGGKQKKKVKTWTNKYTNSLFSPFLETESAVCLRRNRWCQVFMWSIEPLTCSIYQEPKIKIKAERGFRCKDI